MYVEAFTALISKMRELGQTVDLDFETASHKAAKEVFPGIEIECCFFFHFGQTQFCSMLIHVHHKSVQSEGSDEFTHLARIQKVLPEWVRL